MALKVRVVLSLEVDAVAWRETYGPHGTVRDDVRAYVAGLVMDSAATDEKNILDVKLLGRNSPVLDEQLPDDAGFCIDADCPGCGWGERYVLIREFAARESDDAPVTFRCRQCDYTSQERNR
jgi:hypothetical protein